MRSVARGKVAKAGRPRALSACLGRSHCEFLGFILRITCLVQGYFKSGPWLTLGGMRKAVMKSKRILVLFHLKHFLYPYHSSLCDLIQSKTKKQTTPPQKKTQRLCIYVYICAFVNMYSIGPCHIFLKQNLPYNNN